MKSRRVPADLNSSNHERVDWAALEAAISQARKVSVLVVGDVMLDEYVYGTIERISPEAPVSVLDWGYRRAGLGGAANVANNLAHLGSKVFLAGVIGQDQFADELLESAAEGHINTNALVRDPSRPTTVKTRVIAHGNQILRIDRESRHPIADSVSSVLLEHVRQLLPDVEGVVLSDYAKGVLTPDVCGSVIRMAREAGKPVIVDPKGRDFSKYRGAFLLTPNKRELSEATQLPVHSETELRKAAEGLFSTADAGAILVTRSEEGMSLFEQGLEPRQIQAEVRDVFDVTGAGDTVIATLARFLFTGESLISSAQLANIAAGLKVGKHGAAAIAPDELLGWLRDRRDRFAGKIVTPAELDRVAGVAQSRGAKIVFTNGCFDLLHVAHVQFLQKAKALGQILIVAINDDATVRKIKGEGRPLIPASDRARIIAALESVDYVVVFQEATPVRLIERLRPDVLVKGGNYTRETVVGASEVERYGGSVVLIPTIESPSGSQHIVREVVAERASAGDSVRRSLRASSKLPDA